MNRVRELVSQILSLSSGTPIDSITNAAPAPARNLHNSYRNLVDAFGAAGGRDTTRHN